MPSTQATVSAVTASPQPTGDVRVPVEQSTCATPARTRSGVWENRSRPRARPSRQTRGQNASGTGWYPVTGGGAAEAFRFGSVIGRAGRGS